ncbi:MAG: hypothetical protein AMXMBFR84_37870 [Candidatus Hydrogenedentota bacterium]
MADVTLTIDANTAKAMREMAKFANEMSRIEGGVDKFGKKSDWATKKVSAFIGELKSMAAAALSVGALVSAFSKLDDYLSRVADRAVKAQTALMDLASIQEPGKAVEARNTAMQLGARMGVAPESAMNVFQLSQSMTGSIAGGKSMARQAMGLMALGTDTDAAMQMMKLSTEKFASGRQLTPEQAAILAYTGAKEAQLTIPGFASGARAIGSFSDQIQGSAFISTLSMSTGITDNRELATMARGATSGLSNESKFRDRLIGAAKSKGLDYYQLSEEQKLSLVEGMLPGATGRTTIEKLSNLGLQDMEARRGMAPVLDRMGMFRSEIARQEEDVYSGMTIEDVLAQARKDDPSLERSFRANQAASLNEVLSIMGPDALKASEYELRKTQVGLERTASGLGILNTDQGKQSPWVPSFDGPLSPYATYPTGPSFQMPSDATIQARKEELAVSNSDRLAETIDRLLDWLEQNKTKAYVPPIRNSSP